MKKINHSKVKLLQGQTALEQMPNLTRKLAGPQMYIKRDDCTGLATGGNKTRKLEYLISDALKKGAKTLVTIGGMQSNHARQTVAAGNKFGLKSVLVLETVEGTGGEYYENSGNVLLDNVLGAQIRLVNADEDCFEVAERVISELEQAGESPYLIPLGGSNAIGALGYVECALELVEQATAQQINLDYIIHATGSAGTQAGLIAGLTMANSTLQVLGVCVSKSTEEQQMLVEDVLAQLAEKIDFDLKAAKTRIQLNDEYFGEGYGIPTKSMEKAVKLLAKQEAILLDPVYTGKAMAGMLDLIQQGEFTTEQSVVFLHTGGSAGLFAYPELFM